MIARAPEDRRAMRRRALRHGHARPAGGLRADLGSPGTAVLAEGDRAGAGAGAGLLLHGRGLLGSRVDDAPAGVRLRLRQAAVRPPARGARAAGARAPAGRARLPEQARPVPGKPRRAPGGGDLRAGHARGRGRHHVSVAGPAVLPSGAVRGPPQAHLAAPGPRAAGAVRQPRCISSTAISWRCSGSRSFATASGACSTAPRPGTATGRGSASSPGPGTLQTASSG